MFTKVIAAAILAGVALAQTFSINTPPSIQQCQPASLTWVGGTAPFIIAAIPQGQTTAPALATIAESVSGSPYTWNVNIPQGTAITIRITDSTGAIAYSSGLTVQAGGSGCLSGSSSAASGASSAASASGAASSASGAASSAAGASSARPSSAAPTTSSAAPTTSSAPASSAPASATSRPAASGAASSSSAAGDKAAFNLPVLALAGVAGFVALGGFATLL